VGPYAPGCVGRLAEDGIGIPDQHNHDLSPPMRIAIDIDSTLHDYWPLLSAAAKRRFGIELPYDRQFSWEVARLRKEQLRACVADTHSDEAISGAEPYPHAVAVVNRWHDAGHFVHITSHRAEHCHSATARWLEQIGLHHDELYCSYDKIARCREIGIDVLIDDSPTNIVGALEAGIVAATLRHPWNKDVCEEEEVICGDDWPELERGLATLLAGDRRVA
jgi:FMN phosphatase YigB (HAD superfamily)